MDSNGPGVKVRGNVSTIYEKYTALARDARSSGNRVNAENLRQHAEHYLRLMNEMEAARAKAQAERDAARAARGESNEGEDGEERKGRRNNNRNRRSREDKTSEDTSENDALEVVTPEAEAPKADNDEPEVVAEGKPKGRRKAPSRKKEDIETEAVDACLLYTSPSPRDATLSRMPSSA